MYQARLGLGGRRRAAMKELQDYYATAHSSYLVMECVIVLFFFFFQAEDGIRVYKVTGVQTCALPICGGSASPHEPGDALPQPHRERRALAAGRDGDRDIALPVNGRGDEAAMLEIVHRVERHAHALGLRPGFLVHRTIVAGGNREPAAGEISWAVWPAPYLDPPAPPEVGQS